LEQVHLIIGLGNPGREYAQTRHNCGFMAVDRLAARARATWKTERRFQARLAHTKWAGTPLILCEPETYMNRSGVAVQAVAVFYKVPVSQVLVVVDDADLPLGEIRLRERGSSGGHHGLESIEQHLGSRAYARLRLGIGRQDGAREITGHVLGKLNASDMAVMEKVLARAADQVECWLAHGLQKAMSQFNGVVEDSNNEGTKQ